MSGLKYANEHAQENLMHLKKSRGKKKILTANKTARHSFKTSSMINIVEKTHYSLTNRNGILHIKHRPVFPL